MKPKTKISFPHMADYYIAFRPIAELLGEVIIPPPITKRTIELGFKHSPECVCIPFKYNLGNYIESLDRGANLLIQAGGGCRFGYYGEVQEEILRKMGYKFKMIKLGNDYRMIDIIRAFRKINPNLSIFEITWAFLLAYLKLRSIDSVEAYIRPNIGFEKKRLSLKTATRIF
jgi:hypothetical protein